MSGPNESRVSVDPVQLQFASILRWVVLVGLVLMFAMSVIYATGLVPSSVSPAEVPQLWQLSAEEYLEVTGGAGGWSWIRSIAQGQNLALAALVFFPTATIGMVAIAAGLYRKNNAKIYAIISLVEALVLALAATGLLSTGG